MDGASIAPKELFTLFGIRFTETMVSAFIVTALILLFCIFVRIFLIPRWEKELVKKSGLRLIIEYVVGMFDNTGKEQTHNFAGLTSSLYLGLSAFICFATLIELFGFRPATSDLNLAICMGCITFVLIFILGFVKKKHRRLVHYLNPIHVVSDAVLPVSMAVRLFASVYSGYLIVHLLYEMLPIPLVFPIIANVIFTLLHAVLQAYIFMFLSMSFINEAVE